MCMGWLLRATPIMTGAASRNYTCELFAKVPYEIQTRPGAPWEAVSPIDQPDRWSWSRASSELGYGPSVVIPPVLHDVAGRPALPVIPDRRGLFNPRGQAARSGMPRDDGNRRGGDDGRSKY